MRTSVWIALALLTVTLAAGLVTQGAMQGISERYISAAQELRSMTAHEEWQRARETTQAYLEDWRSLEPTLQMLINHDDTDDVTLSLVLLEAAIEARDIAGCLTACAQLEENAQHLYHRDAFTLGNVL